MLNKSIALFAAFTTALAITGTAEAGGCHGGGYSSRVRYSTPSPSYQAELKAKQVAQARAIAAAKRKKQIEIAEARAAEAAKRKQIAAADAKAAAKAEAVAEAKVETKTETVAEVASEATTASTAAEQKVASVDKTCSKFIPATGTTVEVECAKE